MEILSCFVITLEIKLIQKIKYSVLVIYNIKLPDFFKDKFIYKSLILMPEILNETHLGINF